MRLRKTLDLGRKRIVTNVNAPMYGNHNKRYEKVKETSVAVKRVNQQHAVDYCNAMLEMNFKPHDWHIALTYSDENYVDVDEKRAAKDKRNFINKMKRRCEKSGIEFKYLTMTEKGVRSNKIHHHFVVPSEITRKMQFECWPFGQIRILNTLYADGDFYGLAQYYVDKTKGGQKEDDRKKFERRYSFSKNCLKPEITYETNLAETWLKVPRAPKGWYLDPDSLFVSTDSWGGYPFQKYTLIKIEEDKHDRLCAKNRKAKGTEQKPDCGKGRRSKKAEEQSGMSDNQLRKNRHKRN